jgi:hypothetical protein
MIWRYVEGRSGSRANSPRCGVLPSCSPLRRRCRHDDSTGNVGPWRRLHDDPERAWAGFSPSDRLGAGARFTGRVGRGVRPVGPVAASGRGGRWRRSGGNSGGRSGEFGKSGGALPAGGGPFRPCAGPNPHRCLHRPGHAPGQPQPVGRDPHSPAMAGHPATHRSGLGRAGVGDTPISAGRDRSRSGRRGTADISDTSIPRGRPGQAPRPAGDTAIPHYPTVGRGAEDRGGEP